MDQKFKPKMHLYGIRSDTNQKFDKARNEQNLVNPWEEFIFNDGHCWRSKVVLTPTKRRWTKRQQ